MKKALNEIAVLIDSYIRQDSYPQTIAPDYLREAVTDYPTRGGKRLRPAILMWSCGLFSADPAKALPAAAAIEILHNFTLVHDDIIDNDATRRGNPTSHCRLAEISRQNFGGDNIKYGRDFAILAGDLQQAWAVNTLLKSADTGVSPELTLALARKFQEQVTREVITGEALDVEQSVRALNSIAPAEVEDMLYLKTSSLLRFSAEAGAAIALNDPSFASTPVKLIGEFAVNAGIAFQLRDDWLGIFGDFAEFGKKIGSDLSARKATIMLLYALANLPENECKALNSLLGKPEYTEEELNQVRKMFRDSGAEKHILDKAAELTSRSRAILAQLPDNPYRELFAQLLAYLVERNH